MRCLYKTEESVNGLRRLSHRCFAFFAWCMARYRSETHSTNHHRDRRLNHSRQRRLLAFFLHLATLSSTHLNSTPQKLGRNRRHYRDPLQLVYAGWRRFGLSARAAAATQALLQLPFPLRLSMVILPHALNMARPGSALEIAGSSNILSWVMTCITWPIFEEIEDFLTLSEQRILVGTSYVLWLSFTMREDFEHDVNDRYWQMVEEGWFVEWEQTERAPCLPVFACVHRGISVLKSTRWRQLMGCSTFESTIWSKDSSWSSNPLCDNESSSSQDEEHNVDNVLLHSFAHYDHSPLLQSYLLHVELCKSALTCRFAMDVISLCQIWALRCGRWFMEQELFVKRA